MVGAEVVVLRQFDRMRTRAVCLRVAVLIPQVDRLPLQPGSVGKGARVNTHEPPPQCPPPGEGAFYCKQIPTSVRVTGNRPICTTARSRHRPVTPANAEAILQQRKFKSARRILCALAHSHTCPYSLDGDIVQRRSGACSQEKRKGLTSPTNRHSSSQISEVEAEVEAEVEVVAEAVVSRQWAGYRILSALVISMLCKRGETV